MDVNRRPQWGRWVLRVRWLVCWPLSSAVSLGTFIGWRPAFEFWLPFPAIVFLLSFRLERPMVQRAPEVKIDMMGVFLAASAIILISLGFNNPEPVGGFWVLPPAQCAVPGGESSRSVSGTPPIFIVVAVSSIGQAFLMWTHRRQETGKTPLLALDVYGLTERERGRRSTRCLLSWRWSTALNFTDALCTSRSCKVVRLSLQRLP